MCARLIEAGADLNVQTELGRTPLMGSPQLGRSHAQVSPPPQREEAPEGRELRDLEALLRLLLEKSRGWLDAVVAAARGARCGVGHVLSCLEALLLEGLRVHAPLARMS